MILKRRHCRIKLAPKMYNLILPFSIYDDLNADYDIPQLTSCNDDNEITLVINEYHIGDKLRDDVMCYHKSSYYIADSKTYYTCYIDFTGQHINGLKELFPWLPMRELLLTEGCILLHSATIATGECGDSVKCVSFTAPSETGKSTQAYNWRDEFGARVMCEDRTVISVKPDGCIASTYPIDSRRQSYVYESESLGAIVILEQGSENSVLRLKRQDAVKQLYFLVMADMKQAETSAKVLEILLRLTEAVPVYLQTCRLGTEPALMLNKKLKDDGIL